MKLPTLSTTAKVVLLLLGFILVMTVEAYRDTKNNPHPRSTGTLPPVHIVTVTLDGHTIYLPVLATNLTITVDK